jgi:hypothetical protein
MVAMSALHHTCFISDSFRARAGFRRNGAIFSGKLAPASTIPLTEPRWIKMVEIRPSNLKARKLIH